MVRDLIAKEDVISVHGNGNGSVIAAEKPFISVICPIRNEERHIVDCLRSIMNQDYDKERMEIIVVDGMSDDKTRSLVRQMRREDERIKLLDNPARIVPGAMNLGILQAGGDVIVRVDGHAMINENYLNRCIEHLEKTGADCVGGPIESINRTYVGRAIALAMSFPFGMGNSRFRTSNYTGHVDTLAFGAYRREVFERIGMFDEELVRCQDDELNYRLRKFGGTIFMTPDIRSRYFPRASLKKLWRQFFQYGYWKVRVMQKHSHMMQPRQFVPGAFVCAMLGSIAIAPFVKALALLPIGILAAYSFSNILASLALSFKRGIQFMPMLPLIFFILHFGYGLGFVWGLIKFCKRWKEK